MPTITKLAWSGFIAAVIWVLICFTKVCGKRYICWICRTGNAAMVSDRPDRSIQHTRVLNLCFWGGLYGIVFGLVMPRLDAPYWLCGLALGIIAALVGLLPGAGDQGTAGWRRLERRATGPGRSL